MSVLQSQQRVSSSSSDGRENEDERSAEAEEATARCSVTRKIRTKQRVVSECLGLFWLFL